MPGTEIDALMKVDVALAAIDDEGARDRVLKWALSKYASDGFSARPTNKRSANDDGSEEKTDDVTGLDRFGRQAKLWIKQNTVDHSHIENLFHCDPSGIELIASSLGNGSTRDRVQRAYLLAGVIALLSGDDPAFTDESARELCKKYACYDIANHSGHVKSLGASITGSKKEGFTLTAPGKRAAADIVKKLGAGS